MTVDNVMTVVSVITVDDELTTRLHTGLLRISSLCNLEAAVDHTMFLLGVHKFNLVDLVFLLERHQLNLVFILERKKLSYIPAKALIYFTIPVAVDWDGLIYAVRREC